MGFKRTRSSSIASVNSEGNRISDVNDSVNDSDNDSVNDLDNEPDDSSIMDQKLLNRRHLHICVDANEDLLEDCDDNDATPAVSVVVRNVRAIAVSAFNVSAVYLFWVALHFVMSSRSS